MSKSLAEVYIRNDRDTLRLMLTLTAILHDWPWVTERDIKYNTEMAWRTITSVFSRSTQSVARCQLFRSRHSLHHLHHSRRHERCRVRVNFIRVFEVKLPSANFLSLSLSLPNAPLNNDFGKHQREASAWLIGWLDRLDDLRRWIKSRRCGSEPSRANVGTYYSAKFKGRFRVAGAAERTEGKEEREREQGETSGTTHPLSTIELALILHRLKFIDGMLRRLLRPRPARSSSGLQDP